MFDLFSNETPSKAGVSAPGKLAFDFLNPAAKVKELSRQVDWVFTQRRSEYLAAVLRLQTHKSVMVRRKVASGLAAIAGKEILDEIQKWQAAESDRQTWLILESLKDKLTRDLEPTRQLHVKVLTVSEALTYIKKLLGEGVYYIEGELCEVRPFRNMYYFALKDKQDVRLNCWALEQVVERIDFPFNEGLSVRLTGKFKLSKDSKIYFETYRIQLTGEGELLRNLQQLEQKLRQEGLFDSQRKRPIPQIPKNILLIASPNSAALSDFVKVLQSRRGGVNIYLLPIKTQGVGAEALLLEQLSRVNQLTDKWQIDTIVITRGGGSTDDLFVFNSEKIVRAIHGLNRPTVVAIGHERDTTLAEMVADLRCSTPSQAAEKVSLSRTEISYRTTAILSSIYNQVVTKKYQYQNHAHRIWLFIRMLLQARIDNARLVCSRTGPLAANTINQIRLETGKIWQDCCQATQLALQQVNQQTEQATTAIRYLFAARWSQIRRDFQLVCSQIWLHDPQNILARGYALILQNGQVREKLSQIEPHKPIQIRMQDGEMVVDGVGK